MKYGLQLYSIRDITQNDLASAIKKTAELGYNCVEFAGFFGHTANEINSMLENSGLEISGTHSSFDDLVNNYEETVAYHKAIGNRHYIIPGYDISGFYQRLRIRSASILFHPPQWTYRFQGIWSSDR